MAELLKAWLRARLGVIMDLSPEIFGRYVKDGTLLAQILHSYDIISSDQLGTILRTQDPALSRVNLRTLRIWLKLVNVTLSDESIEEISKGKGTAALQLFYKVYLSLEGKDRLHFIALQKEREKYTPTSNRFDISKVSEDPPPYQPPEHPLSKPLIEATDTVLWHRDKFWRIVEACRWERQRFEATMKYPVVEEVEHFIPKIQLDVKKIESERLDEFARKHPARKMKKKYHMVECCPTKGFFDVSFVEDPAAAAKYIDSLKKRGVRAAECHELKLKTQTSMMMEAWERLQRKQDRFFDEALGRRVLDQSRYEKQMIRKLCEVRDLRNKIVENRRLVDAMLLEARESEQRQRQDRCREKAMAEMKDVEAESHRMRELRRRIREEKVRRLREKHRGICAQIAMDLADIAVKFADYRQANGDPVPRSIWSEWRTLFLKNQPMFEFTHFNEIENAEDLEEAMVREMKRKEDEEETNDEKETERFLKDDNDKETVKDEEKQKLIKLEMERQSALADADFENYRDLASPWDEFAPQWEKEAEEAFELGRVALGYVVHRLLAILHPYPTEVIACPVPRVNVAAIVLGVTSLMHEQLRELLKRSGMRLLRMEDAINHCLERYKREMANVEYIDLSIVAATVRDAKKSDKSKTNDSKDSRSTKQEKTERAMPRQSATEEKQTQTPRQIPYDDMHSLLSDTAYIGKWTYEFLTLGQPISNELNTKILIEYLKGIEDVEGWALMNYPDTYEQLAMLEKALTGQEVPPDRKIIDFADVNIEDIDPLAPRIVFESDEIDTLAMCRQSRLLPNPISGEKDRHNSAKTFMTKYIKVLPKPKTLDSQAQFCIPLLDDATSIDEYYTDQNIAYGFYYSVLDLPTTNALAKFIAGDRLTERKTSSEFLQEAPQIHDEKKESPDDSKAAVIKRWIPKSEQISQHDAEINVQIENRDAQSEVKTQLAIKPGENGWQWLDLPQSPVLLQSLAMFWETVEEAYVENLKQVFSLKRIHISAIVPYKNLVLRNMTDFIERPDERQKLLSDFHRTFNEIDEDLREDLDTKCELHCRVADFRAQLWELCDTRRHKAEEERQRILRNRWIAMEAAVLVNVYIGILQTEVDKFVDTVQLVRDYYTSMSQKPLQESRFSKIFLDHIELETFGKTLKPKVMERSEGREERTAKAESIKDSARTVNFDLFKTEIEDLLMDVSRSFELDRSTVYNAIEDGVRRVRAFVDATSSMIVEILKREEKAVAPKPEFKGTASISSDSMLAKLARRGRELVEEWRYAVSFEIDRIRQRLDVLSATARSDTIFLLDTMRETFHRIYHRIVERYKREIESINDMANVFCFAIEEARPIRQELLLDGDQFVVRSSVSVFPDGRFTVAVPTGETASPLRFRAVQLARLLDIFQRIAPHGTISERGLIYVLQDLVSCSEEDCYPPSVPCAWRRLRPPDIETLIEQLFGPSEHIEWREFLVYAIDLPVPSHEDLLRTRAAFRMRDPESREVITRDQYRLTPLWFLERAETPFEQTIRAKLREDYEILLHKFDATDAISREEARLVANARSSLKNDLIETSESNSSDTLRLILAKELLYRMYLVNRHTVNYTAMLLAFCKNKDSREGLGKAFTLAMGGRVCTDTEEGERYVAELREQKSRIRETKLSRDDLREEANEVVQEIVNHIINRVAKGISAIEQRRSHELTSKRLMIQMLDGTGEIDPADLLPAEVISEHLVVEDSSEVGDDYEYEQSLMPPPSEDQEEFQLDERVIFWLPRDVCLTVLATCLPWHASQADLFQTSLSLREGIARAYDELRDDELNDREDVALAHRLVNHSFVRELLSTTSKFISRDMSALLRNIFKGRDET